MTNQMVEDEWSDAQADFRRLFEENGHPMWVLDGLEIVVVNRAALLHYGYSRDEFLALTIGDLVVIEEPAEHSEGRLATNVAEPPPAFSKHPRHRKHRKKDGSFIDVEVTSFAVTFRKRPATLESILDVTYRRKTEAQAGYLELLLATVEDAVVASDETFVVTGWNAAAESTFGRRADEVLGRPDEIVFRTNFVDVERAEVTRMALTGEEAAEMRVAGLTPAERDVLARGATFGGVSGFVVLMSPTWRGSRLSALTMRSPSFSLKSF